MKIVRSIAKRLGLVEQKLGICKITKKRELSRARTRLVSLDTGRVPQAGLILSLVFLYYLSNSNNSKCNRLICDEK